VNLPSSILINFDIPSDFGENIRSQIYAVAGYEKSQNIDSSLVYIAVIIL